MNLIKKQIGLNFKLQDFYTEFNNNPDDIFATPLVPGDKIILEIVTISRMILSPGTSGVEKTSSGLLFNSVYAP